MLDEPPLIVRMQGNAGFNLALRSRLGGPDCLAMPPWNKNAHLSASRQSANPSAAAARQAMTLAQDGMSMPFTVISHPARARSNCSNATSQKTATAVAVKGFKRELFSMVPR